MILLFIASMSVFLELVGYTADHYERGHRDKTAGKTGARSIKGAAGHNYNLLPEAQCDARTLDFMEDAFDDRYLGCADLLEAEVMPKLLTLEKSRDRALAAAWDRAEEHWRALKPRLRVPADFLDEFGIAVAVYTTDWPEGDPVYRSFNRAVGAAGRTRHRYVHHFQYKALHFYLTRALQLMKRTSRRRHTVYRGTDSAFRVSHDVLRFGSFTSTSLSEEVARTYLTGLFLRVSTCFGVDIHRISAYPRELEVLIPGAEVFQHVRTEEGVYVLNSTGQLCSFFNCAVLGEEKRNSALCSTVV